MFFDAQKKIIDNFNSHNQNLFRFKNKKQKIFLVEFNGWSAIHIIFSYIINFYKTEKNCKIVAYECFDILNRLTPAWYTKYLWKLGVILNLKTFKIFKSFGTDNFIKPNYTNEQKKQAEHTTNIFFKKDLTLKQLENFKIEGIWIGDLIYDSYLKKYQYGTIDLNSLKFKLFFLECAKLFYFWNNFFNKYRVEAIAGCHAVYVTGIPLRIANQRKLNCFAISGFNCDLVNLKGNISFNKKINGSDIQFKYYQNFLKKIPNYEKKKYLIRGKKIIQEIISGKKRYLYLQNSSFKKKNYKIKNTINKKIKVAIFVHDFVDSPHIYGNHFFSDFQEWFNFLEKNIKKNNYDWYIKDHPASSSLTKIKVAELLEKNKNLKLIKKNFPNNKLKEIGINYVLTVYGTVASELPIYGIKVISASRNHPHKDFNFSINPTNLKQYKNILTNLKKENFKINEKDLYYFHFVKDLFSKNHIFFQDQNRYFDYLERKPLRFTPRVYKYWLEDFNLKKHYQIKNDLADFINKGDYFYLKSNKF